MKRIAVTGMNGVIGSILNKKVPRGVQIISLSHSPSKQNNTVFFDLLNKKNIPIILDKVKPDVIIHLAAMTHIDACEADKKWGKKGIVWKTNVEGTKAIAKYSAANNIPLIFLSTECVFDGRLDAFSEDATKNPINWYGKTKSIAEDVILSSGARATIIRSVVAYHKKDNGKTIYGKILNELKSKGQVSAVEDQLFTPTSTYDIVRAIWTVVKKSKIGIYHVAPKKNITPYDFAVRVALKNNFSRKSVVKTSLQKYYGSKKAALRLLHSSLSGKKSSKALGFIPRNVNAVI